MGSERRLSLAAFTLDLLSRGQAVFSHDEAERALGIHRGAFLDAAEKLQRKGLLVSPRRGFYVIVPPQFHSWGAPPPTWYIDDLMQQEGHPYYVALLKAAELHGAAHQAPMEFQVLTDQRILELHVGRSLLTFYYRRDMAAIRSGIEDYKTDTGKMRLSSIELTIFDLLRYPHTAGGLNNIATIFTELGNRINSEKLGALSPAFERSVGQRLGHLLSRSGHGDRTEPLFRRLSPGLPIPWIELDPMASADPDLSPAPTERDERWRVIVRRSPESDV